MNHYEISRNNGSEIEKKVSELFDLTIVNKNYDAVDKFNNRYEIKSCQEWTTNGKRKRRGAFVLEEKDYEDLDKTFIFVVHRNKEIIHITKIPAKVFVKHHLKTRRVPWKDVFSLIYME
ncbi:MAG: hypothetical protein QXU98_12660 [Candidatus Parvarchaeota archaeon]